MKLIFQILLGLGIPVCGLLSSMSWMDTQVRLSDLEQKTGVLQTKPEFSRDEYDTYNTMMRLRVEGMEVPLSVPGKLLRVNEKAMAKLKTGDKIAYYQKKESDFHILDHFFSNTSRRIYGLVKDDQVFFTPEDAFKHYKSPNMYIFGFLFLGMAMLCLILLVRMTYRKA